MRGDIYECAANTTEVCLSGDDWLERLNFLDKTVWEMCLYLVVVIVVVHVLVVTVLLNNAPAYQKRLEKEVMKM